MTLEEIIRDQAEEYMKKAVRLSTQAALTDDIWLRVMDRECADVYSKAADDLLVALRDADDIKKPARATNTDEPQR